MNASLQRWFGVGEVSWRQLVMFKAGWFGLVLAPSYSALLISLLLVWFIWQLQLQQRYALFTLWGSGVLLDLVFTFSGLFEFDSAWLPYWLVLLWGWFSLFWVTVFSRWLQHSVLVALFGLIGGPMAYWGGAQLSDSLQIASGAAFWLSLAPAWALLLLWSRHAETWLQRQYQNRRTHHAG